MPALITYNPQRIGQPGLLSVFVIVGNGCNRFLQLQIQMTDTDTTFLHSVKLIDFFTIRCYNNNMYLQKNSVIHRLNPLTRIFSLFLLWGICIVFQQPLYLLGIFGMIFIIALIGQCFKKIAKIFYLFLGISICSVFLWSIGDRIFHLNISKEFLLFLLSVWFKMGAVILVGIIFISCIIVEELDYGLSRLGIYHGIASLITMSFRWICLYHKTRETIIRGQSLRGMDTALQSIREKLSSFILSINITTCRFQATIAAMEGKGFGISRKRSYSGSYPVGIRDYIALTFIVFFGAFCLFLRLSGYGG